MTKKDKIKQQPTSFSLFSDWRLFLYNLTIIVFSPYLLLNKFKNTLRKRNLSEFLKARCTTPTYAQPNKTSESLRIVFICSGFGEKQACDKLTKALKVDYPQLQIISTVRGYGAFNAIRHNDNNDPVSFYPFDFWPFVKRWYQKLNPDIVVAMRLLWLPNIIWAGKLWGVPVCTIGVPPRKYKPARTKLWTTLNRWTLRGYDAVGFLTEEDKQAHLPLFDKDADVRVTGSTRFLQPQNNHISSELKEWICQNNPQNLPVIVAGSLHIDEIELILNAFQEVQSQQSCLLVMAPRQLSNTKDIEQALLQKHLNYSLRSQYRPSSKGQNTPSVLILDTMGELSRAYCFAKVAYVGGTLRGVGHNIYEPLEWKVPVFFGHGNGKIHAFQKPAMEAGVGFRINSAKELADGWHHIISDLQYEKMLEDRCHLFIGQQQMDFQKNMQLLIDMIELRKKVVD
jgi:3-deoxy-D-manno-octulosonic-acid transferase